jgi:hypothetical protein
MTLRVRRIRLDDIGGFVVEAIQNGSAISDQSGLLVVARRGFRFAGLVCAQLQDETEIAQTE